jgi:fermentation-respiration switch protein FrsA (DUF1100 family)
VKIALLATIITALALYLAVVLLLFFGQRAMIYPAPKGPAEIPPGFEKVVLNTADGLPLTAAWRPAAPGKRTVLFFHGNGDSLPGAAFATQALAQAGYGVLLADYRGYAGNPGEPSEQGLALDARAALAFARSQGLRDGDLVFMGASLGTGVATALAAEYRPAALVLVSPFTSLPDVGAAAFPWAPVHTLMRDRFPSLETIRRIEAPVLVLHAADDRTIPFSQGEALAKAAPRGSLFRFEQTGHQLQYTESAQSAVADWLAKVLAPDQRSN